MSDCSRIKFAMLLALFTGLLTAPVLAQTITPLKSFQVADATKMPMLNFTPRPPSRAESADNGIESYDASSGRLRTTGGTEYTVQSTTTNNNTSSGPTYASCSGAPGTAPHGTIRHYCNATYQCNNGSWRMVSGSNCQ